MNWDDLLYNPDEKPLDRLVEGYSYTSIFRTIAFIGDSLSSGEFETRDEQGNKGYHDMFEYSWAEETTAQLDVQMRNLRYRNKF